MAGFDLTVQQNGDEVPDSYLDEAAPDTNYGSSTVLKCGVHNISDEYRAILKFDLSAIPVGSTIDLATLRLYCITGASSAQSSRGSRVTQQAWTEAGCNWNKRDSSNNWGTAGGDFTTTDEVILTLPTVTGFKSVTGFEALALDAVANRAGQLHVLLRRSVTIGADHAEFASGEHATTAWRPEMRINYTPPGMWYYIRQKRRRAG